MNLCGCFRKDENGYHEKREGCRYYKKLKEDELMSKVNVDEIQVGDLVGYSFHYSDRRCLGIVTETPNKGTLRATFSDIFVENQEALLSKITGHWKVINFEEESKMNDELKVYTGKETLQALLEGKTITNNIHQYRLKDKKLEYKGVCSEWTLSKLALNILLKNEFTEVVLPQVGDWVRVTSKQSDKVDIGQLTLVEGNKMYAHWNDEPNEDWNHTDANHISWEILSPEQIAEYKRELAFSKVGRKLNKFRSGDIVYLESLAVVATVITKKNDENAEIKLHGINEAGKGYKAKPHQLTPISFIEDQVDLS